MAIIVQNRTYNQLILAIIENLTDYHNMNRVNDILSANIANHHHHHWCWGCFCLFDWLL